MARVVRRGPQPGVSSGGKKSRTQASQGNFRPTAANVAQGGTNFGRATPDERKQLREQGLTGNTISREQLLQLRADNEGLSKSQSAARRASEQAIQQRANTLEQQRVAQQSKIRVAQISKKNVKILKELEAIDEARRLLSLTNTSQSAKVKLRKNFTQKENELRDQLKRNQTQQSRILGGFESKIVSVADEQNQQRARNNAQESSQQKPASNNNSRAPFAISQSSVFQGPTRPKGNNVALAALQSSFGFSRGTSLRDAEITSKAKVTSKQQKSDVDRFFEGFAAPISNVKTQAEDFFGGLASGNLKSEPLGTPGNILGLPVPKNPRPLKETASSQIFSGRAPDLRDPSILGSAVSESLLIAAPVGAAKAGPRVSSGLTNVRQKSAVSKLAKQREPEGVFGIEKIGDDVFAISRGTEGRSSRPTSRIKSSLEIFDLGNRRKSAKFTDVPKQVNIPKGRGGEADVPLTVVRFGERSRFGSKDAEVIDIRPTRKPVNNPDEIIAIGNPDDFASTSVGLTRTSKNTFAGKPGPRQRQTIREAEDFGTIRTVAEGDSAPLSKVRSGDLFDFTGQGAIKTKVVAPRETGTFGQRKGTVGGPAGRGGIDVGSKSFDRKLLDVGLSAAESKGRRSGVTKRTTNQGLGDALADDIISGNAPLTARQKTQLKQNFGGSSTSKSKTKSKQSNTFALLSSQSVSDSGLEIFSTPQRTAPRKGEQRVISEIPINIGLFDSRREEKQRRDQLGVLPKSEVKQDQGLQLGFTEIGTQKQKVRTDQIPIFRTGSRAGTRTTQRQDQVFRFDSPTPVVPETSLFSPPTQPRRQTPAVPRAGIFRGPFPDFPGFGGSRGALPFGKTRFELFTGVNPVTPFGGNVEGFGGIIRTRSNRALEAVDDIFVGEAKRQARKKKGFSIFGTNIISDDFEGIDLFPSGNKKGKKKRSKGIFDLF